MQRWPRHDDRPQANGATGLRGAFVASAAAGCAAGVGASLLGVAPGAVAVGLGAGAFSLALIIRLVTAR